jgi:hypothetical protein
MWQRETPGCERHLHHDGRVRPRQKNAGAEQRTRKPRLRSDAIITPNPNKSFIQRAGRQQPAKKKRRRSDTSGMYVTNEKTGERRAVDPAKFHAALERYGACNLTEAYLKEKRPSSPRSTR